MKRLLYIIPIVLLLGVWFGPVRSVKIRHHCNQVAAHTADGYTKSYGINYGPEYYQVFYDACVRSH